MSHPACDRCGRVSPTPNVPANWSDDPEPTGALLCPVCVAGLGRGWDSLDQVHQDLAAIRFRLARVPLRTRQQRERGLRLAKCLDATLDRPEPSAPVRAARRLWRRFTRARSLAG